MGDSRLATIVMVFSGEYDLASKDQLRAVFDSLSEAPSVVLDFSDVTYLDSTVISELVRMHNGRAASRLEPATLVMHNKNLLRVFNVLQLPQVFRVVEALDNAVAKNGEDIIVQYASSFAGSVAPHRNGSAEGATA